MRALSNADFLTLWESGQRLHSLDRGLLAIRASFPEAAAEGVADWSLGRRNQALAELHAGCFGAQLQGWTECGRCGEKLEFALDCRALVDRQQESSPQPIVVKGCAFRVPTSRDLARIVGQRDREAAALCLLDACRVEESGGCGNANAGPADGWSAEDLEEVGEKMVLADPLAEISLSFECPACNSSSEQTLDLPAFVWAEVEAYARRMLHEIHTLAAAYGWGEAEILSLSDARRAIYLQMVQA
jgi:hypothetical protein